MSILLDGTGGVTTPGVVNTAGETIATTLSVTGATNLGALTTTGNTILGDASTDTLNVGNGGLVKDASGNVGIGTASPGNKLTVVSTGNIAAQITGKSTAAAFSSSTFWDGTGGGLQITNSEATTNAPTSIRFTQTGSPDAAAGIAAVFSSSSASNLVFCTNNGGVTTPERMRIDSSGNLLFNSGYGSAATAYGCRAWVNFNGTGVVAIRASGNVSSITDVGVGDYTVNFTTAMVDTNYTVVTSAGRSSAADYGATTTDTPNVTTAINYSSWVNASPIRGDVPFNALAIFR